MQDPVYQVNCSPGQVESWAVTALGLCRINRPDCTMEEIQASMNAPMYRNGLRRRYADGFCEDSRIESYHWPEQQSCAAWVIRREINRYVFGNTVARKSNVEESQVHSAMYVPFADAIGADSLEAYTKKLEPEPIGWHRLAVAAILYAHLFYNGNGQLMLAHMKAGDNQWIEFVIQVGYTQILPQLLDYDPVYTAPDPQQALLAELSQWNSLGGTNPGRVSAPPKGFPTPVGWMPSIWPVVNAVTGALVTIPGLPPPCRPFPQCILQKVPGLTTKQMWDIIKAFVAKTPGVNLILDENGLRYVPPKSLPKPPSPQMQGVIKTALEERDREAVRSEEGMSGMAVAGLAGAGVLAAAILAVALSDD